MPPPTPPRQEYLAPEIINGSGHSSEVDWWSLGILMYELAFGVSPFRGPRRDVTFDNILHKPLTFPSKVDVSDDFKDCVRGRALRSCGRAMLMCNADVQC